MMNRWRDQTPDTHYTAIIDDILARKLSPHQAVAKLLNGRSSK
jgi:hypothetical protein